MEHCGHLGPLLVTLLLGGSVQLRCGSDEEQAAAVQSLSSLFHPVQSQLQVLGRFYAVRDYLKFIRVYRACSLKEYMKRQWMIDARRHTDPAWQRGEAASYLRVAIARHAKITEQVRRYVRLSFQQWNDMEGRRIETATATECEEAIQTHPNGQRTPSLGFSTRNSGQPDVT